MDRSAPPGCNCTRASCVFTRSLYIGLCGSSSSTHISSTLRMGLELFSSSRKYLKNSRSFWNSPFRVRLRTVF